MIKINFKNALNQSSFKKFENNIKIISNRIDSHNIDGYTYLGPLNQPDDINKVDIKEIKIEAKRLYKKNVEMLVVIAEDISNIKAPIDMVQGEYPEYQKMKILYIDSTLSATNIQQKLMYAETKNFAINIIAKKDIPFELGISFRLFKKLLESKIGINNSVDFISVTTDASSGPLLAMARELKYKIFYIPSDVQEIYSSLTAATLFPAACVGLKISNIVKGAKFANSIYCNANINKNDAYKYAVARNILARRFQVEIFVQFENQMKELGTMAQKLFAFSSAKNGHGLVTMLALFPVDANNIGQMIQSSVEKIFKTTFTVEKPNIDINIPMDKHNFDNINYLTDQTINKINKVAHDSLNVAHTKIGKVPNIDIQIEKMDEFNFGELIVFLHRSAIMSAYLNKVNPFSKKDSEIYRQNIYKTLGKP